MSEHSAAIAAAARRRRLAGLVSVCLAVAAPSASAQGRGADLVDLVLGWTRGGWRTPLTCSFEGTPREGLRRVLVVAGPRQSERRVNRVTFLDLEARAAERCTTLLGGDAPNVIGSLLLGYTARRPRSDTPERDFDLERRGAGLVLDVVSGRLRIGPVAEPAETLREIDFAGGTARFADVQPGTDAARVLQDFGARRKLSLALEALDGTRLEMPLVEFEPR